MPEESLDLRDELLARQLTPTFLRQLVFRAPIKSGVCILVYLLHFASRNARHRIVENADLDGAPFSTRTEAFDGQFCGPADIATAHRTPDAGLLPGIAHPDTLVGTGDVFHHDLPVLRAKIEHPRALLPPHLVALQSATCDVCDKVPVLTAALQPADWRLHAIDLRRVDEFDTALRELALDDLQGLSLGKHDRRIHRDASERAESVAGQRRRRKRTHVCRRHFPLLVAFSRCVVRRDGRRQRHLRGRFGRRVERKRLEAHRRRAERRRKRADSAPARRHAGEIGRTDLVDRRIARCAIAPLRRHCRFHRPSSSFQALLSAPAPSSPMSRSRDIRRRSSQAAS